MNNRGITVTDEKSDFIIYFPIPCSRLLPMGTDIPPEGCQIFSIDPAPKTFSIWAEKRYAHGYIQNVFRGKYDFSAYGNVNETNGTTGIGPGILAAITLLLQSIHALISESKFIIIERPLAKNYITTRIYQHLLTYFTLMAPTFKYHAIVMDISPKLKGKMLGAPPHITYYGLKSWAVDKAIELLTYRGDQESLEYILSWKKKGKTKAADQADAAIQIEAFFKLLGGITTQPLQTINIS